MSEDVAFDLILSIAETLSDMHITVRLSMEVVHGAQLAWRCKGFGGYASHARDSTAVHLLGLLSLLKTTFNSRLAIWAHVFDSQRVLLARQALLQITAILIVVRFLDVRKFRIDNSISLLVSDEMIALITGCVGLLWPSQLGMRIFPFLCPFDRSS